MNPYAQCFAEEVIKATKDLSHWRDYLKNKATQASEPDQGGAPMHD